ncbi:MULTISPECIES: xanthine dehydrogenase accessory protein XdhC [unclassified Beijerinckia]|uniref:xanthine dehydrogenase accessory protein XdhC n=1 Tax=unclassified Beijerinckia TaxID=2638183 RepID=UPI00089C752B|nr:MULTISPECIES: xanthine dehydrogenase accessory protein XdhC [unclassified Beijerinckia]MDH7795608.1 xanthine dehydrogenase accessory factor [Beijerinckia sp. GAS462]SEC08638.1 molybdenum cofactor sulfurylase [Beijerinckia sp. 28-YEA-48]
MTPFRLLLDAIASEGSAALVSLPRTAGSSPRDTGAWMVVRPSGGFNGTIGGGALEYEAIAHAREALARAKEPVIERSQALGPDLGQCCGGRVWVRIETFDRHHAEEIRALAEVTPRHYIVASPGADGRMARRIAPIGEDSAMGVGEYVETFDEVPTSLLLFGAGHVGRALVLALAPLPFVVRWIDPRRDMFPAMPANVTPVASLNPVEEIDAADKDAFILVMTHSHALDFDIVARALAARRFPYVGLIGSATKRARFEHRLADLGLGPQAIAALVCPIGIEAIEGKLPAVIAASTVAQLLIVREHARSA